jgi:hypothetical protein
VPEKGWKSITIRDKTLARINRMFTDHQEALKSLGVETPDDLLNLAMDKISRTQPLKERLEHFNVYQDHVTIQDNELGGRLVNVYIRDRKFVCDHDRSSDCIHVGFAMSLPEVKRRLGSYWV